MTNREIVVNYIRELANEKIADHSANLFENGNLTSLDVLDLISFIETTFDLQISAEDVDMESFASINGLVHFIDRCKLAN